MWNSTCFIVIFIKCTVQYVCSLLVSALRAWVGGTSALAFIQWIQSKPLDFVSTACCPLNWSGSQTIHSNSLVPMNCSEDINFHFFFFSLPFKKSHSIAITCVMCSALRGKWHLYRNWLSGLADVVIITSVCVCNEAASPRVGIRGQSSLYAVCRAPRQKHCWAVKHSVTKTTCSRVYDRQTQAASGAPHRESLPHHQGFHFDSYATHVQHCAFYTNQETEIRNRLTPRQKTLQQMDGWWERSKECVWFVTISEPTIWLFASELFYSTDAYGDVHLTRWNASSAANRTKTLAERSISHTSNSVSLEKVTI